jgi:hypothetical protein
VDCMVDWRSTTTHTSAFDYGLCAPGGVAPSTASEPALAEPRLRSLLARFGGGKRDSILRCAALRKPK